MDSSKSTTLIRKKLLLSQFESTQEKDNVFVHNFEEMSEVSLQLAMIRKKYDILKQENAHKRSTIERLSKDLVQIGLLTNVHSGDQSEVESTFSMLSASLDSHRKKLAEEMINEKTYKHIYGRIHEEKIALELRSNQLHIQLKNATQILETEKSKTRKNFEAIHSSRINLKNIKSIMDFDSKQQQERISRLEKAANLRKEAAERREERIKKIAEIADIAANENTESQEISIKQTLLLHKIWYSYLKYKLDKKLKGAIEIEDAYQIIRSATGLQNISEIVSNFIGKEETQAQLLKSIEDANKNLDEMKLRNEKSKSVLKELILLEGSHNTAEFIWRNREIDEKIEAEKKTSEQFKEDLKKIREFHEDVATWARKIAKDLRLQSNGDPKSIFESLNASIKQDLAEFSEKRESFLSDWKKTDEMPTDLLIKSIYQDNYNILLNKHKGLTNDGESSNISMLEDDKRKKVVKKVKIIS